MAGTAAGLTVDRPLLALIGHLETAEAYLDLLNCVRGDDLPKLPLEEIEPLLRAMHPMPICDLTLHSIRGGAVPARYIDVGLLPDAQAGLRKAMARIRLAAVEAGAAGARVGVLGGFTSIVGELAGADSRRDFGLPFTTGNTLAAAVIAEQVASLEPNLEGSTVTVVGAGGDVGSGLSRILHERGVRLLLVGRAPRPLENLATELKGAQLLSWPDAASRSEIVVLAASAAAGSIPLDAVPPQAFVLDAGHPSNARLDAHARYALAGRVTHAIPPECDLPALLSTRYATGESHACLAEGEVLAFEERWEPFSSGRGRIVPDRAAEILGLAQRHGIRPAPLCFAVR
jgi:fatty aldehyde-generating acyl-ACP reductase